MLRILNQLFKITLVGFFLTLTVVVWRSDPTPLSKAEISDLVIHLNEAAAIGVPHDFLMRKEVRVANLSLLNKVESGNELSAAESVSYRTIFQQALAENQVFLGWFDKELSVLVGHRMGERNNVKSLGIEGAHDHHDHSARKNFARVLSNISALETAGTSFARIYWANAVQKNLVDLISHLGVAPHTISTPYEPMEVPWKDKELGQLFENYLAYSKAAQVYNVNSKEYWAVVDQALAAYGDLILAVQKRVVAQTSVLQRRIAGRFNAIQTFAPPVKLRRSLRQR